MDKKKSSDENTCVNRRFRCQKHKKNILSLRTRGLNRSTISDETIADIYMFIREVIMLSLDDLFEEKKIGGDGKRVQIDEMKYGHWKYHRVDGVLIFRCIEESSREIRLEIKDNKRDQESMLEIIKKHFDADSIIISDSAKFSII